MALKNQQMNLKEKVSILISSTGMLTKEEIELLVEINNVCELGVETLF